MRLSVFRTLTRFDEPTQDFKDGCHTPAPVVNGFRNMQWAGFGLKVREMQISDSGSDHAVGGVEGVFMILVAHLRKFEYPIPYEPLIMYIICCRSAQRDWPKKMNLL